MLVVYYVYISIVRALSVFHHSIVGVCISGGIEPETTNPRLSVIPGLISAISELMKRRRFSVPGTPTSVAGGAAALKTNINHGVESGISLRDADKLWEGGQLKIGDVPLRHRIHFFSLPAPPFRWSHLCRSRAISREIMVINFCDE